ncbi:MAG: SDR family NAD(P)-dependent oxidoreductase [Pseudomonadales bacterium]
MGEELVAQEFTGRVAIVTGAGKGLGRAYALQLARQGARVLVNNRCHVDQANSADAVVNEIRASGGTAEASYCSVEEDASGEQLVAEALQHFGQLDIVLANAGVDRPQSFHKQTAADFDNIFAINFHGTARLVHAAWPVLREQGYGRVLVSTSTAGLYGNHGQAAYAASKAALLGLMRSLAIEGRSRGLLINALAPYAVTPLTKAWFAEGEGENFSAEAVAKVCAFILSERCDMTGQCIIAGADGIRKACMRETHTFSISEFSEPRPETEYVLSYQSASEEFEHFVKTLS